jgi:hypothetical protein
MTLIGDLITELKGIRNALGEGTSEPSRPQRRRRSRESPTSERVSGDPIFDSDRWEIADRDLWEEKKQRARRAVEGDGIFGRSGVQRTGIEALAWYVSFHDDQRQWGIYIPLSSLALMDELYLSKLRIGRDRRLHLAWSASPGAMGAGGAVVAAGAGPALLRKRASHQLPPTARARRRQAPPILQA